MATEVLVIDNGSVDDSCEVARAAGAAVLRAPNVAVAVMRNRAAARVSGEWLAFVDADHELAAGWLEALLRAVRDEPGVDAWGALYTAPSEGTWVQRTYGVLRGRTVARGPVEWLAAGNLAVRRDAFETVGGFDERLEACEDVDLCFRLTRQGFVLWADPELISTHHGDPPTLWRVFRSELWRGRDNVRVSLRGPRTPRALASLLMPLGQLVGAGLLLATPFVGSVPRLTWICISTAAIAAPTLLRVTRMLAARPSRSRVSVTHIVRVAAAYDAGRAAAFVMHAGHHRR
jgi:glycosyltransferase involved in cell wall biosynthesis